MTRDIERGTRGISTLIAYTLFSILPTLVEIALVSAILLAQLRLAVRRRSRSARWSLYIAFTVVDHRMAHGASAAR